MTTDLLKDQAKCLQFWPFTTTSGVTGGISVECLGSFDGQYPEHASLLA